MPEANKGFDTLGSLYINKWLDTLGYLPHRGRNKMSTILADGNLKCIFLNWGIWNLIKISLKFVPGLAQTRLQVIIWTNDD